MGLINGWKIAEQNTIGAKLVTKVNGYEQLLTLLDKGRVDIAILDRVMGGWKLDQLGFKLTAIEPPIIIKPNFIYVHKKHEHLVSPIASALADMKKDGSLDAIHARVLAATGVR